jgi:MFS family permease
VAAFAMVATLPGRTHGLGLVTEPLLNDLGLERVHYAALNLWATLLGALFCLPWGWLIDRVGARLMLAATLGGLGAVVVLMAQVQGSDAHGPTFFLLLLFTRGLGQSGLSVVSITLVGRSAVGRSGIVIGMYSFLTAVGFMAAFSFVGFVMESFEPSWRDVWAGIGWVVLASAPITWWLTGGPAQSPGRAAMPPEEAASDGAPAGAETDGFTLGQTLSSPAFWVFAIATSLYGLVAAGVSLFNQSILAERGFERKVFLTISAVTPLIGLASNLGSGWLATRWPIARILGLAMVILAAALVFFPLVETLVQVYLYAAAMGVAGGMITVIFFAVWGQIFGKKHLGKIQGAAQMLTVLASAAGPLLLAESQEQTGSYVPAMTAVALVSLLLAVAAVCVPMPQRKRAERPAEALVSITES